MAPWPSLLAPVATAAAQRSAGPGTPTAASGAALAAIHGLPGSVPAHYTAMKALLAILGLWAVGALAKQQRECRPPRPQPPHGACKLHQHCPRGRREPPVGSGRGSHTNVRPPAAPRPPPPAPRAPLRAHIAGAGRAGCRRVRAQRRQPSRLSASFRYALRLVAQRPDPRPPATPIAALCETYVVAPGDSVVSIAQKFDVSQSERGRRGGRPCAAAAPPATPRLACWSAPIPAS